MGWVRWMVLPALAALVMTTQHADAQLPLRPGITPNTQPTYSPYLNLLRGSAALNYYGIVRPQFQMANTLNALQAEVARNRDLILSGPTSGTSGDLVTGHSAAFLNYGGYFLNLAGTMQNPAGLGVSPRGNLNVMGPMGGMMTTGPGTVGAGSRVNPALPPTRGIRR